MASTRPSTRRDFLKATVGSSALVSLTPAIPNFLFDTSVQAAATRGDNVLVVVQLTGGNDGLNTVIPYADDIYQRNRSTLRVGAAQVHKINDYVGLHPAMNGLAKLLEDGKLSVLQGIGYPNPNRSHFESMDIWQTARRNPQTAVAGDAPVGWLGRYLDAAAGNDGRDVPAIHLGAGTQPLALASRNVRVASAEALDGFKLEDGGDAGLRQSIETAAAATRPSGDELLRFLQRSTVGALASSKQVQEALKRYTTPVNYPNTRLAQQLRTVAQLIEAGMSTRIYYLSLNGFDTHASQAQSHASLLRELSDAVSAFIGDVDHHGHAKRVLVMTFSEFGRRLHENASAGTDHGAAAPMFLAGGRVKVGAVGKHPSLADLDQGDVKFHTDFRRVYAAVLQNWLGFADSQSVLGERFEPADVIV